MATLHPFHPFHFVQDSFPGEISRKNGQESQPKKVTQKHKGSTEGIDRITLYNYFGCVEVEDFFTFVAW